MNQTFTLKIREQALYVAFYSRNICNFKVFIFIKAEKLINSMVDFKKKKKIVYFRIL